MTSSFFHLVYPQVLFLFLLLPLVFYWDYKKKRQALGYSSTAHFKELPSTFKARLLILPPLLRIFVLFLIIVALARPQWGQKFTEVLTEGIDIMLAMDTSGSMKALDFHMSDNETNRLDVVKRVVDQFVSQRTYDRVGMVIFGEQAYTQCPLTTDKETIRRFLKLVRIGIAGDGTAIGNGLATAVKRLQKQKTKSKIVILLTDGRNNAGEISPETAAQIAKEFGIKVYTIGVGSQGPVPYPQEMPFGIVRKVYADLDLDEQTLKMIAQKTGGQYFRATDTQELEKIYAEIDALEKTEVKIKEYTEVNELYYSLVLTALLVFMFELFLRQSYLMMIP